MHNCSGRSREKGRKTMWIIDEKEEWVNNGRDGGGDGVRKREEKGRENNRSRGRGGKDGAASEDGGRRDRHFYVC
jgi:hypothetical protein